jgi:proliferating cell nuclear antigen
MFDMKIRADVLREAIELASCIVEEVKLTLKKDGLSVRAVDPSHVAMIEMRLSKKAFEEFKASDQDIGLDLNKIKDLLKLIKPEEIVNWRSEEKKNRIILEVGNLKRMMSPVDLSGMTDPKLPDLTLPGKVVVDINEIRKGIRAAESISDHIAFLLSPNEFKMEAEGDTEKMELVLSKDKGVSEIVAPGPMRSLYQIGRAHV